MTKLITAGLAIMSLRWLWNRPFWQDVLKAISDDREFGENFFLDARSVARHSNMEVAV